MAACGRLVPAAQEVVEGGVFLRHERLLGVVGERLGDELAVAIEVLDALGQHADRSRR
jgi:hypothetical protein